MSSSVLLTRLPLRTCKDREGHPVSSVVKCHLADYQVSFVPWKSAQACSGLISGPGDMVHACRRLYALSIQTHGRYHVINMDWRPERSSEIQEHAKLRRSKMTPGKAGGLLLFWLTNVNKPSGRKGLHCSWLGNPEPGIHVAFSFPLTRRFQAGFGRRATCKILIDGELVGKYAQKQETPSFFSNVTTVLPLSGLVEGCHVTSPRFREPCKDR